MAREVGVAHTLANPLMF